jgi:signal transduction histidine kinase
VTASTEGVRNEVKQLASVLLVDVEEIAERAAARMQELLPAYAPVPRAELVGVVLGNTRSLLAAVAQLDPDRAGAEVQYRVAGETRARQGITSDEMLNGWRIGLEVVREQAQARADGLGIGKDALLEFVVATLQWGDVGMRASASAHHEAEIRQLGRLVTGQRALRRVATLVAQGAEPAAVFEAVAGETLTLMEADSARVCRYEPDRTATVLAERNTVGQPVPVGTRLTLQDQSVTAQVLRTRRASRRNKLEGDGTSVALARERGLRSAVGAPIVVEGRLWGLIVAHWTRSDPVPDEAEARINEFAELVAAAIANAESRDALGQLAEEQAALRRVAELVAQGGQPSDVLDTVAAELAGLLEGDHVVVCRYEADAELTVLAYRGTSSQEVPAGARINHEGDSVEAVVRRTERSARLESYEGARGTIAELARAAGVQVAVGAPVVVDGRLWGVASVGWNWGQSPPADTEERMARFAALLGTAIANANSRDQLTASRARVLTMADETRRRVVRDLHDGAQQRLVQTIVTLKLAQQSLEPGNERTGALIAESLMHAQRGNSELRELAHGILPAVLTQGGLRSGISSIVSRLELPVEVEVTSERFPEEVEASAYFVVAEALTNVIKHANAERAEVRAFEQDGTLHVEVRDDGVGGADPRGHGLVGLSDRVAALDGRLTVQSPVHSGTTLVATLPLGIG